MKNLLFIVLLLASFSPNNSFSQNSSINLAGYWDFKIDSLNKGLIEKWYLAHLPEKIKLPGSMTENGKGDDISINTPWTGSIDDSSWFYKPEYKKYRTPGNIKVPFWLQPDKYYVGAAWYQKQIDIPTSWKAKHIELFLERCHWETRVWIDDKEAGMQNALGAPHYYDLTALMSPGKHTLTIYVDNRIKDIRIGINASSISDNNGGNWNGIVGKMELRAQPPLYASNIRIYTSLKDKKIKVKLTLNNISNKPLHGMVKLSAEPLEKGMNGKLPPIKSGFVVETHSGASASQEIEMEYPMGPDPLLWDEFHPNLYCMNVTVTGLDGYKDQHSIEFGIREFKTKATQFTINGRLTFLRGTLECAIFPKTGYPATDTASWMRIFRIARSYGLNHMRFHSWCPPEAAFEAADRNGFYLHVECSVWAGAATRIAEGKPIDKFIYDESERIVSEFGNHPSFCMMLYGNEPGGDKKDEFLARFVTYWKNKDPRRLYSTGAGWPILPESDFNSAIAPRIQGWGAGLRSIINRNPPQTEFDWSKAIAKFEHPTLSHEVGQWCAYPDFKEIPQYNGVLKAKNFEIFQETLAEHNMAQLADSFLLSSGKLQALCYKADIEAALRTPGFGGFQLLDLHDFPGQGTALVGVLNAFWNEKGYMTAKEFRHFCGTTVPLARLPKMIYNAGDTINASVEIAHFGEFELTDIIPVWKMVDNKGNIWAEGQLPKTNIPIGNAFKLGAIHQPIVNITKPLQIKLTVKVGQYKNSWDLWLYPSTLPIVNKNIVITQSLDYKTIETLKNGGDVLLTIKKGSVKPDKGGSVAVGFSSIFWNTAGTKFQPPHTLGILCNSAHPALNDFPTEYHSNYQWWDAITHSNAILLSDFPKELKTIVRFIDDWTTNRPLGLIFEARVGKGRIIVSGADLLTNAEKRPEARQLLYSLKNYMAGSSCNPSVEIDIKQLNDLFIQ